MKTAELEAQLAKWAGECASVSGQPLKVPERLWAFLASRLAETLPQERIEDDPDVVTASLGGRHRKVRITGTHAAFLTYEATDGAVGSGLVQPSDVLASDRGKLTAILERLRADGKISSTAG